MIDSPDSPADYPPIAEYALIGDCHTAALIHRTGSIDWYCPGRFDAPAAFCRILDVQKGGYWQVAPLGDCKVQRQYRPMTNVLDTTYTSDQGQLKVTDFMPIHRRTLTHRGSDVGTSYRLIRLLHGISGNVQMAIRFKPTFNYAASPTHFRMLPSRGAIAYSGDRYLTLWCLDIELRRSDKQALEGQVELKAGQQGWLVLNYAKGDNRATEMPTADECGEALSRTLQYWNRWAASCTFQGPYRDAVMRSALTIKLLTYEPSGAIVAAPTTSLPEEIGGIRNWDYRFTWLRDSSLMLYALMTIGYQSEARDFIRWLARTQHADRSRVPQIMYTIDSKRNLPETKLTHLAGYRDSRPVRIGNAAAKQFQLDIYGELLTAAYVHFGGSIEMAKRKFGKNGESTLVPTARTWALLRRFVDDAVKLWEKPDRGIWEVRGGPQLFLYSRLMCWAAVDRGIRLAEEFNLTAPLDRWRPARDTIRDAILAKGFDPELGAFTQAFGSKNLDASALAITWTGFLAPTDPRMQSTIEAIRKRLTVNDLVHRYVTPDGLPGQEGAFIACSFWLVDALALSGRLDEAHRLFEHLLGFRNDLGLISEEIEPSTQLLLGNFPQGFSHLALIRCAVDLSKIAKHGPEQQPVTEAQRAKHAHKAASEVYGKRDQ